MNYRLFRRRKNGRGYFSLKRREDILEKEVDHVHQHLQENLFCQRFPQWTTSEKNFTLTSTLPLFSLLISQQQTISNLTRRHSSSRPSKSLWGHQPRKKMNLNNKERARAVSTSSTGTGPRCSTMKQGIPK